LTAASVWIRPGEGGPLDGDRTVQRRHDPARQGPGVAEGVADREDLVTDPDATAEGCCDDHLGQCGGGEHGDVLSRSRRGDRRR
jgi:hypothetical protein